MTPPSLDRSVNAGDWSTGRVILFLSLAAAAFVGPLLVRGSLPPGDDLPFALQLSEAIRAGWADGVWWTRWVDSMNIGLGAPALVYYSPLAPTLAGSLAAITGDLVTGLRVSAVVVAGITACAFYVSVRPWASARAAALGACVYVLLPYHFIDLYVRFALAETLAFAWAPLIFRFARELAQAERPRGSSLLGLALCYAALVLTHLLSAYLVLFALALYFALATFERRSSLALAPATAAGVIALLLCGFFLYPLLSEREWIQLAYIQESGHGQLARNFLFRDEVAFGFTPSRIKPMVEAAFAATLLPIIAAGGLALWLTGRQLGGPQPGAPRSRTLRQESGRMGAVALWVTFLQLPISAVLWTGLPLLEQAQFPWRFSLLQSVAAAWLVTCAIGALEVEAETGVIDDARSVSPTAQRNLSVLLALAATLPILVGLQATSIGSPPRGPEWALAPGLQQRLVREYLPTDVSIETVEAAATSPPPKVQASPPAQMEVLAWRTHHRSVRVDSRQPTTVTIATFAHPAWRAQLDGGSVVSFASTPLALISVEVPSGQHTLSFDFVDAGRSGAGIWASALGLAIVCGALIGRRWGDRP
jgi:hypothetical protein